ncbi:unnamed protein product, partial [Brachionus calyciflorus]
NDKVRLHSPATRQALQHKLRNDKWTGSFKVLKLMDNNNVELEIGNGKTKIVHVNRIKHAEVSRDESKPKSILKKKNSVKTVKHVRFKLMGEELDACTRSAANHDYNLRSRNRINKRLN